MSRKVSLSLLDQIHVASPCPVSWESMTGDGRVRFCGQCRLNVYNIAEMTREEAEAMIAGKEGRLCARFHRRADGTILTRDCPVGLRLVRQRAARAVARVAAAVAFLIGGGLSLAGMRSGRAEARLRQMEPFSTLCRWLSPAPPPPALGKMIFVSGDICVRPPPPPPSSAPTTGR